MPQLVHCNRFLTKNVEKNRNLRKRFLLKSYQLFEKIKPLSRKVQELRYIFGLYYPGTKEEVQQLVMGFWWRRTMVMLTMVTFFFFTMGLNYKELLLIPVTLGLANEYLIQNRLWNLENRLFLQLENYLGILRHTYDQYQDIEEALNESLWEAGKENGRLIEQMLCVLTSGQEEWEGYRDQAPNRFYFSLFTLCRMVVLFGDQKDQGQSVLLKNLNSLKREVRMERLKRKNLEHKLSGLFLICIMPLFFLQWIEDWGISNLQELEKYYKGSYGIIVFSVILCISVLGVRLLKFFRRGMGRFYYRKNWIIGWLVKKVSTGFQKYYFHFPGKVLKLKKQISAAVWIDTWEEVMMKRIIIVVISFMVGLGLMFCAQSLTRERILGYAKDYQSAAFLQSGSLLIAQEQIVEICSNKKYQEASDIEIEKNLQENFFSRGYVISKDDIELLVQEIRSRFEQSESISFSGTDILILFGISIFSSFIPIWKLQLRAYFIQRELENEISIFQAVLSMLRHMERADIPVILDWLESVSEYFRESLSECFDCYDENAEEALQKLREKETLPDFGRIVEDIERCDRIGIWLAFQEIEGQRELFLEKRKLDNEQETDNKAVIAKAVAFLPVSMTIGLYLVVPFVLESITQLYGYLSEVGV